MAQTKVAGLYDWLSPYASAPRHIHHSPAEAVFRPGGTPLNVVQRSKVILVTAVWAVNSKIPAPKLDTTKGSQKARQSEGPSPGKPHV